MRKIREVLRLKFDAGLSVRKIASSLRISSGSAGNYLHRFNACGLTWPTSLSDAELERCLFPPAPTVPSDQRPMPDWAWAHAELRRPGVTLALLWQEYRLAHPQGFQYSWFCEHYRLWAAKAVVLAEPAVLKCVTNAGVSQRCCIKDGSRPPGVCLQGSASNRPVLLRSKGVVVSDRWKRR